MADIEKLPLILENLELLKEDRKDALELFDNIISHLGNPEEINNIDSVLWAKEVSAFLGCGIIDVETKAAEAVAALCKAEPPRAVLSKSTVITPLIKLLSSPLEETRNQACRAIGNICYENNEARACVLENYGLTEIIEFLRTCSLPDCNDRLRSNAVGCLLNVIMNQDHIYPKVIEMGVIDILCDLLMYGVGTKQAEERAIQIYVILGLLTDSGLSERLCGVTVKVLAESTSGELSELCVELLHSQAENDEVRLHLARAGLCELLIELMEKHCGLVDDDETRNLLKMACDLIVIILNGDASMAIAYGKGKGRVFEGLLNWLSSSDDDLQVTAVLAMANFARTDNHCIQMVSQGVSKKLLSLLSQNNTADAKIRLQHALLSALRNLVIPAANKAIVLEQGLFQALYPMFDIPTFPVVFKLLGTLRMVIDGQSEAASELGSKEEVISKLVEWCNTEDHPGVQGEANRLLARIIKNSREREVIGKLVQCGAMECLVKMTRTEHVVMQSEAFLALNLATAMRGQDAESSLLKANVGEAITTFLSVTPPREVFHNILAFVGQLANSGEMRKHLCEAGVPKALYSSILCDALSDLKDQVSRLATMLDSG
ncbi:visceral mesodermal armadillo-repeats [Rhodnius prolixus]